MSPLARAVLGVAVGLLPVRHRDRYRRELAAELHDLPAEEHVRYALRVMARAPFLRGALSAVPVEGAPVSSLYL